MKKRIMIEFDQGVPLILLVFIAFNALQLQHFQIIDASPTAGSLTNQTYLEDPSLEELVHALSNGFPLSNYTFPKPGDILVNNGSWTLDTLLDEFPGVIESINLNNGKSSFLITESIVIGSDAELDIVNSRLLLDSTSKKDNIPTVLIGYGNITVLNSTISSWNSQMNMPDPNPYHPRPILVARDGGRMDVFNSTISNLGFSQAGIHTLESSLGALNYYNTTDFAIVNSTLAHNLYGFYSDDSSEFQIINNKVFDQVGYGLDPHTGSRDFIIDSNHIYANGLQGIICSFMCTNASITNNVVEYNNQGIGLHWLTNNSLIKDNTVKYNKSTGIFISNSSYHNLIEYNTVVGNGLGIELNEGSNNNTIRYNTLFGNILSKEPIVADETSKSNVIENNMFRLDT